VLSTIRDQVQVEGRPVLMGQSLGALAALHAAWTTPGVFAGLLLQSGSFFTPQLDPQESGFEFWPEVTGFVASVRAAERPDPDAPVVTLTCGTAEENHANNVALHAHLTEIGLETGWGEVRDGHTWTCWRDSLHPHLTDLLTTVWA
jgi:enterochelin esterase-like enzyme